MANKLVKLFYYLSAGIPFIIVFVIWWAVERSSYEEASVLDWIVPTILSVASVAVLLLFLCFFSKAKKTLSILDVAVVNCECVDEWVVGYWVSYLLPLVSIPFGDVVWVVVAVVIFILLICFLVADFSIPHPLLLFCRYHFYSIEVEEHPAKKYIVMTKKNLRDATDIKKVNRLFESMLIRME